jgi:hypothetical protein
VNAPAGSTCQASCLSSFQGPGWALTCTAANGWVLSGGGCGGEWLNVDAGGLDVRECHIVEQQALSIFLLPDLLICLSCAAAATPGPSTCSSNPTPTKPLNAQDWVGCAGVTVGSACSASCLAGAVGGFTARCTASNTWDYNGECSECPRCWPRTCKQAFGIGSSCTSWQLA